MMLVRPTPVNFTLSVDWLRANATKAHFFGLGFIQVKLTDNARLHFYHPDIPPFVEDPHDHRYDFISTVLQGCLQNKIWRLVEEGADHEVGFESCKQEESEGPPEPFLMGLTLVGDTSTAAGCSYYMSERTLHTVHPIFEFGPIITLVEREQPHKKYAVVVRKIGTPSVCPFSKPMPDNDLWAIVGKCIEGTL